MDVMAFGEKPELCIFSGIHGDEWRINLPVRTTINKYKEKLTPFLFIPVCSPSAVQSKSRNNIAGNDFNRSFTKNPSDKEVLDIINILRPHSFKLCVDIHEDYEFQGVYVYDNYNIEGSDILNTFRKRIKLLNIPLYSGIDDNSDKKLAGQVNDGYRVALPPQKDKQGNFIYEGFFDTWALIEGKTQRWLTLEVPTSLSQKQKENVIEIFIQTLVLPGRIELPSTL